MGAKLATMATWTMSTALGSTGVFCGWASCYVPFAGMYALLCLGSAVALQIAAAGLRNEGGRDGQRPVADAAQEKRGHN